MMWRWLASASVMTLAACASNPAPAPIVDARAAAAEPVAAPTPAVAAPAVETPAPVAEAAASVPAAPDTPVAAPAESAVTVGRNDLGARYLDPLLKTSCRPGTKKTQPGSIELKTAKISLSRFGSQKTIGKLDYVAGFQLSSADKRFGGLSGLDMLDDGGLLAVSDEGDFVWIDLDTDGLTPKAARLSGMTDDKGVSIGGKGKGDAEGLAVLNGVALVSFEGDHRVLAYDLGKCGGAARGAPIVFDGFGKPLPKAFADANLTVWDNAGAEALAVAPGYYLLTGLETQADGAGVLSARAIEAAPVFDLRIDKGAPELVGLDVLPAGKGGKDLRVFSLHRDATPGMGTVIAITETYLERYLDQSRLPARIVSEIDERSHQRFKVKSTTRLAEMGVVLNIDNFEGIAAKALPDGRVRLFVISDDNFSASQRTLLMAFETRAP